MSGRRRSSEMLWDKKEEKTPPEIGKKIHFQGKDLSSRVNRGGSPKLPDNFSERSSWEPLQGKGIVPKDDDINRGRWQMQRDPTINERERQCSIRPSDDSYGLPYRHLDRRVGGSAHMNRDRSRTPYRSKSRSRSRSRSQSRGSAWELSRNRSRSRNRDRKSTRVRSRSPFCDDRPDFSGGSRYSGNGNSSDHWRNMGSDGYKKNSRLDEEARDIPKDAFRCKDFVKGWCHKGASCRFQHHGASEDDYHRDDRNLYDGHDRRHQPNRKRRLPCRFFAAGKCNRDDCKFSHDISDSDHYDERSHDNVRGCNLGNKNRTWDDQQPHDDLNVSDFSYISKSKFGDKNKSWNGPLWDEVGSGGFDERSHHKIQGHTSDDKNRTWDCPASVDAVQSKHNYDNKKKSWDGPSWDDVDACHFPNVGKSNPKFDNKNSWNGSSWDEVSASGFSNVSKTCHNTEDSKKSWNGTSSGTISASGCSFGEKSVKNMDEKTKSWNGSLRDEVSKSGFSDSGKSSGRDGDASCFSNVGKFNPNLDNKNRLWNGPSWDEVRESGLTNVSKACHNSEDSKKSCNEPLWDEASKAGYSDVGKSSGGDGTSAAMLHISHKTGKWDDPGLNDNAEKNDNPLPPWTNVTKGTGMVSEDIRSMNDQELQLLPAGFQSHTLDGLAEHVLPEVPRVSFNQKNQRQGEHNAVIVVNDSDANNANRVSKDCHQQFLISGRDSTQSVRDGSSETLSYLDGAEQSHHMPLSNIFSGPKMSGQVQGMFSHSDSKKQMEIQNKGGQPINSKEVDVPQVINDVKEISMTSELTSLVNASSASVPEIPQKAQLPQVYTEPNLTNAINFLKSLPNSAFSGQDTKRKEQHNSARSTDVGNLINTSVPMGILSGSVRQENQMPIVNFPPMSTAAPNSSKFSEIGIVQKEHEKSPKTKKQEPVVNPIGTDNRVAENAKQEQENINPGNSEAQGKVEEGNISNDEKAMRQFKVALVEFVKEILKPTWKEGKMSREAHKSVVKKVVDKVTSTIQGIQVPRTQARIEQYLAYSKPKITKLVEAYVERLEKA